MSIGGFTIDYGPFAYLNIMYIKLGFEFDKEGGLKLMMIDLKKQNFLSAKERKTCVVSIQNIFLEII